MKNLKFISVLLILLIFWSCTSWKQDDVKVEDKKIILENLEENTVEIEKNEENKKNLTTIQETSSWIVVKTEIKKEIKVEETATEMQKIGTFTDISQCDWLSEQKTFCKDKFLIDLASEKNVILYCNKISDVDKKEICRDNLNYKNKRCFLIKKSSLKEKCELESEEQKKEIQTFIPVKNNQCFSISEYNEKIKCVENKAMENKNIKVCDEYFLWAEIKKCYKDISYVYDKFIIREAFMKKDLNICEKVYNEKVKLQCKKMTF